MKANLQIELEEIVFFYRWKVLPHYLQGVDCLNIDTSTQVLGETLAYPICASPSGFHRLGHERGELETATGLCHHLNMHSRCAKYTIV